MASACRLMCARGRARAAQEFSSIKVLAAMMQERFDAGQVFFKSFGKHRKEEQGEEEQDDDDNDGQADGSGRQLMAPASAKSDVAVVETDTPGSTGGPSLAASRAAVAATSLPLLVACAQFDPPRFQAEFLGLMQDRLARHGAMPRALIVPGHNHYSMPMHLGTADRRLADEICAFVRDTTG